MNVIKVRAGKKAFSLAFGDGVECRMKYGYIPPRGPMQITGYYVEFLNSGQVQKLVCCSRDIHTAMTACWNFALAVALGQRYRKNKPVMFVFWNAKKFVVMTDAGKLYSVYHRPKYLVVEGCYKFEAVSDNHLIGGGHTLALAARAIFNHILGGLNNGK